MCAIVRYSDKEFETVGELKGICPILIKDKSFDYIKDDQCLCQLNLRATAKVNGFQYLMLDCGDVIFNKI